MNIRLLNSPKVSLDMVASLFVLFALLTYYSTAQPSLTYNIIEKRCYSVASEEGDRSARKGLVANAGFNVNAGLNAGALRSNYQYIIRRLRDAQWSLWSPVFFFRTGTLAWKPAGLESKVVYKPNVYIKDCASQTLSRRS